MTVYFSQRSLLSLQKVLENYDNREIGGIFLGHHYNNDYYVIEHVDFGLNFKSSQTRLEYNDIYINHVANLIAPLYKIELDLIGFWHSHDLDDIEFSSQDDTLNRLVARIVNDNIISAIINVHEKSLLTIYEVDNDGNGKLIKYIQGDSKIPKKFMELKNTTLDDFISINSDY